MPKAKTNNLLLKTAAAGSELITPPSDEYPLGHPVIGSGVPPGVGVAVGVGVGVGVGVAVGVAVAVTVGVGVGTTVCVVTHKCGLALTPFKNK